MSEICSSNSQRWSLRFFIHNQEGKLEDDACKPKCSYSEKKSKLESTKPPNLLLQFKMMFNSEKNGEICIKAAPAKQNQFTTNTIAGDQNARLEQHREKQARNKLGELQ